MSLWGGALRPGTLLLPPRPHFSSASTDTIHRLPVYPTTPPRQYEQQRPEDCSIYPNNSTRFPHDRNSSNALNSYNFTDDRSQLLARLSPLEPKLRHRGVQERRDDKVGEWLVRAEEFRGWGGLGVEDEDDNTVLFCYGDPGVCITFIRYARILLGERRKLKCMSTVLKSPSDNRQTVRSDQETGHRRYVLLLLLCDLGGAVRVGYAGTGRWWNREDPGGITASPPIAENGYR